MRVRTLPYVWGRTDCGSLVREAMLVQFGEDLLPALPQWLSTPQAARTWEAILRDGGIEALLKRLGAVAVVGRRRTWPMGTVLVTYEDLSNLPALGVYIGPILVQSDQEHGVMWADPKELIPDSAWLLERATVYSNG